MNKKMKEDYAYMAGFFDADGCISVSLGRKGSGCSDNTNKLIVHARIQQIVEEPLLLFKTYFGGYLCKKKQKTTARNDIYYYVAMGNPARLLLEAIFPYLIVKKSRVGMAIKLMNIKLSNSGKDKRAKEKWDLAKNIIESNSKKGGESKVIEMYSRKFG